MKSIDIVSKIVAREGEAKTSPSKGIQSINLSDYLLKSVWDKVFEVRTDSQGTEYIFSKVPIIIQYGITMYSGDGVDVPSLASGLPFDGRTIWYNPDTQQIEVIGGTGGGSGEGVSNFWDLSGIPSWITNSKPKYTYSEIEGTPDLTKYALASQIPSLSGYATESWVLQKNYATKATTLSGYGITDAYTKTNVDDLLKSYVTLGGTQTITGEKNFTGGLKVNGSPIYYDTEKKYWKLEGDLLVTGGVTMYGSDSSFVPSTIMDAILYDSATLGINSNGQLYVKGGTSGGGLDITALQNYLTQNSYLNVTGGDNRYLQLSGGTLTNTLTIDNSNVGLILHRSGQATPYIRFGQDANKEWGELGVYNDGRLVFWPLVSSQGGYNQWNTVWHSGNDGSGSGLDADTLDGLHNGELTAKELVRVSGGVLDANTLVNSDSKLKFYSTIASTSSNMPTYTGYQNALLEIPLHSNGVTSQFYFSYGKNPYYRAGVDKSWNEIAYKTDNVSSATKLQTARTIWGQSFDGTGNVTGQLNITTGSNVTLTYGTGLLILGTMASAHIAIDTNDIQAKADGTTASTLYLNDYGGNVSMCGNGGNVGIGTTNPKSRLSAYAGVGERPSLGNLGQINTVEIGVTGSYGTYFWTEGSGSGFIQQGRTDGSATAYNLNLQVLGGNVGIGTASPSQKLHVVGNIWSSGDIGAGAKIHAFGNLIANGKAGIGLENPTTKLHVLESSTHNAAKFETYATQSVLTIVKKDGIAWAIGVGIKDNGDSFGWWTTTGQRCAASIDVSGNFWVNGGITMYSDQRKKTILNHVELSLKQIAEAPLIEHYYNGDDKRTTHVGSIAQYWASMNDWFCKLDGEGYYTMEIQNAALASAISIARELDRYETKTDKAIKKLKKRICELEEEVERLKSA